MASHEKRVYQGLRTHLRALMKVRPRRDGYKYSCPEEFVLKEGKPMNRQPLTAEEERILSGVLRGPYKAKECYYNAMRLILASGLDDKITLLYVEGYAFKCLFPVPHAWATLNGKPVDVTWGDNMGEAGYDRARSTRRMMARVHYNLRENYYYGVAFPAADAARRVLASRYWTSIIDDWEHGYPLLKNGIPDDHG